MNYRKIIILIIVLLALFFTSCSVLQPAPTSTPILPTNTSTPIPPTKTPTPIPPTATPAIPPVPTSMGTLVGTSKNQDVITTIGENNQVMWYKPGWQGFIPLTMPKYYSQVGYYNELVDFEPSGFVESNFGTVLVNDKKEAGMLYDEQQKEWVKIIRGIIKTEDTHVWEWNGEKEFIDITWPEDLVKRWQESPLGYEEWNGQVREERFEITGVSKPVYRWDAGYLIGINTQDYVDSYIHFYAEGSKEYSQKDKGSAVIPNSSFDLVNVMLGWEPAYLYAKLLDQQKDADIRIFEPGGRARYLQYIQTNPDIVITYRYYDYVYKKSVSIEINPAFDRMIIGRDVPFTTYPRETLSSNASLIPQGMKFFDHVGDLICLKKIDGGIVLITRDLLGKGSNGMFSYHVDDEPRYFNSGIFGIYTGTVNVDSWLYTIYQWMGRKGEFTTLVLSKIK